MPKTATQPKAPASSKRVSYARSRETRAKILAAALAEASEAGFHKTSVARIAARAGVAVGNLHYHFGSRGELLRELMRSLLTDLLARLKLVASDENADYFDVERAALLVYLQYLRDNPGFARLSDEIKIHEPTLYHKAVAGWVEVIGVRMRESIEHGTLRPMADDEVLVQAHLLLGSRHYLDLMMHSVEGRPYPGDEAVVDAYLALLRGGLAASPNTGPTE